jgi:hypothetical protein
MIKEINIKVSVNHPKNISIKCDADTSLTIADIIRVTESLMDRHIDALKKYALKYPEANLEKVTLKDLSAND